MMSRPKMTEAHRIQIREEILDSAYSILVEKGPEHISSRAVAKHLDLTHMGLFTYFPNQPAILRALSEREQAKICAQLQLLTTRSMHKNCFSAVEDGLQFLQSDARNNPHLFRLAWITPEIEQDGINQPRWMQPTIDLVASLIREGKEQGCFVTSDPEFAAMMVIGMVNLPFILSSNGRITSSELRDRMARDALTAAMHYLKKGQEPVLAGTLRAWATITGWVRKKLGLN